MPSKPSRVRSWHAETFGSNTRLICSAATSLPEASQFAPTPRRERSTRPRTPNSRPCVPVPDSCSVLASSRFRGGAWRRAAFHGCPGLLGCLRRGVAPVLSRSHHRECFGARVVTGRRRGVFDGNSNSSGRRRWCGVRGRSAAHENPLRPRRSGWHHPPRSPLDDRARHAGDLHARNEAGSCLPRGGCSLPGWESVERACFPEKRGSKRGRPRRDPKGFISHC